MLGETVVKAAVVGVRVEGGEEGREGGMGRGKGCGRCEGARRGGVEKE